MENTNVPKSILDQLAGEWDNLTPEARKAAKYVLDNPQNVGVSTVREIAEAAQVKPNTVVRMARQIGLEGYEDLREGFRQAIRDGQTTFTARTRWLQEKRKQGQLGQLYSDMVSTTLRNIEETFAQIDEPDLRRAAEAIWNCRNVYVLGVGVNNTVARNFTYLARTGMVQFYDIPRAGSTAVDDLAWANEHDVLIAITSSPYRTEVVEATKLAKKQGLTVIAISDSLASPIIRLADHGFLVSIETPQFFPSSVPIIAVLETLLSFVVASASEQIVERVEQFHQRRREFGMYQEDNS